MDVIKRSGAVQAYDPRKITEAMRKAFVSVGQDCGEETLTALLRQVELAMGVEARTVEDIQDEVERALMGGGYFEGGGGAHHPAGAALGVHSGTAFELPV